MASSKSSSLNERCGYLTVDNHRVIEQRILCFFSRIELMRFDRKFHLVKKKRYFLVPFIHLYAFFGYSYAFFSCYFPIQIPYNRQISTKDHTANVWLWWILIIFLPKKMVPLGKSSLKMHRCHLLFIYWCWVVDTATRKAREEEKHAIKILDFLFCYTSDSFIFIHLQKLTIWIDLSSVKLNK